MLGLVWKEDGDIDFYKIFEFLETNAYDTMKNVEVLGLFVVYKLIVQLVFNSTNARLLDIVRVRIAIHSELNKFRH